MSCAAGGSETPGPSGTAGIGVTGGTAGLAANTGSTAGLGVTSGTAGLAANTGTIGLGVTSETAGLAVNTGTTELLATGLLTQTGAVSELPGSTSSGMAGMMSSMMGGHMRKQISYVVV